MQKSISQVEAYWNSRPCNSRHSTSPIMRQYSEQVSERKYRVEPHIPGFSEFEKWKGKRVLDIGCGIGTMALDFARAGAKVTAVDLSEKSLEIARKRAVAENLDLTFGYVNAEDLNSPFTLYDYYDLVYAFGSIHHSPNPEAIIHNARGVLRPGGTLKLMVYNKYSWKSLWVLLKYGHGQFWKFDELIARYSEAQTGCPITHTYSKRELRAMLERNGFHIRKMDINHIFPYDIEAYKRYEYKLAAPWKWLPDKFRFWLEKKIGWHLLVECTV